MTHLVRGDPASLSALAATLTRVADALETRGASLSTAGSDPLAGATLGGLHDTSRALVDCAAALQDYAVDLQHARILAGQAAEAERRSELITVAQQLAQRARAQEQEAAARLVSRVAEPVHALRAVPDAVASAAREATGG